MGVVETLLKHTPLATDGPTARNREGAMPLDCCADDDARVAFTELRARHRAAFAAFLSHCKADAAADARLLKDKLEMILEASDPDVQVFLDSDNLGTLGDIYSHIRDSKCLLCILTPNYFLRRYCLLELMFAHSLGKPILFVQSVPPPPPRFVPRRRP